MRDGWRKTTLGEFLSEIARPVAVADLKEVRYAGVRLYTGGVYARESVSARDVKTKTLTVLRQGDVTYNRMWATKASFGVAGADVDGCHVTNDFPIFEVDESQTSGAFVKLFFESPEFQTEAAARATGTTERRRLKQRDFLAIPVILPLPVEQRRIVDLIASVDDAVEAAEAEASTAEVSALDLRNMYFSEGASTTPLGKVAEVTAGKQLQSNSTVGELTPYLRAGNIANGSLDLRVMKQMALTETERGKLALRNGDVVVVEGGNGFGKSAIWRASIPGVVAYQNHVLRLRTIHSRYPTAYLSHWARWCHEQGLFRATGSGIPNIGLNRARNMPIRVSESDTLPDQLSAASGADYAADTARDTADALRALRSNLLTVLLSGQHGIPATYDALLEGATA